MNKKRWQSPLIVDLINSTITSGTIYTAAIPEYVNIYNCVGAVCTYVSQVNPGLTVFSGTITGGTCSPGSSSAACVS